MFDAFAFPMTMGALFLLLGVAGALRRITDRERTPHAAHVLVSHPEQGWSLLCNGVVLFEDTGELLPDGKCVEARRAELLACATHRAA